MLFRYMSAIIVSVGITYGLFFLMSTLIATGKNPITEKNIGQVVDFVRIKQDEQVRRIERELEKPDKPETPPPVMPRPQIDPLQVADASINTQVNFNTQLDINADSLGSGDGDYLPIVKVAPDYPRRALERGIEGFVIVEFIVTKLGTVENVQVIQAEPSGYFERAAVKAAQRFKYKPKVINGEPVSVAGVRNKITFKIEGK